MAKEKEDENLENIRIEYWKSLGWEISQSLGLWNAEKQFEGIEEKFTISGIETFENLDTLLNLAEQENAKTSSAEKGLSVFQGETTVNLDGETVEENFIEAELEEEEPKKPSAPRVFETLKVVLTKDQKEQKMSELLQIMNTKDETESRFESVKKSHQAEVKDLEKDIIRLRTVVDTGAEWRDVECEQRFDYTRGIVDIFRVDTGVYVRSRQMKDSERQAQLFG